MPILEGIRVLEIAEGVAGPVCGLQLADLGATVIKVEPPGGDRSREWGPPMAGEDAAIFAHLNRGKQSVVLDLSAEVGRQVLECLLPGVDAVLFHMDPPERAEAGLDWDEISERHPHLVIVDLTDMGDRGPLAGAPGSELVVQALSGFTRYIGEPGGAPNRVGYEIAGMAAGMHASQAVLTGLLARKASGRGQVVRISALGALLSLKTILLAAQSEQPDEWNGFHLNGARWPRDTGWQTSDGQVTFDFRHGERAGWVRFCEAVGLGHLPDRPDYQDWRSTIYIGDRRFVHGEVYRPVFARMTSQEASDLINGLGGISVKWQDYAGALSHPQVQVLQPLVAVPGAAPGAQTQLGEPFRLSEAELQITGPAPVLGEHTRDLLSAAGLPTELIDQVTA